MRLFALVAAVLMGPMALASTVSVRAGPAFGCGTRDPTVKELQIAQSFAVQEAEYNNTALEARQTVNINVYFHVLASATGLSNGYLTTTMLNNQFSVLQNTYAPHGFTFTLVSTDFTINSNWANNNAELAMKKALRKGTYRDLNIYFYKTLGGNFGYCYFPTTVTTGSNNFYLDGCSILYTTVPGGSATNYNLGYTVTHEVGHWFGLYHTFQGGCTGAGDSIADTPAQSSATSGCPASRDSCPSQAGQDPIHNYMDYSYDTCYTNFTPNQKTRMSTMFNTYRGP